MRVENIRKWMTAIMFNNNMQKRTKTTNTDYDRVCMCVRMAFFVSVPCKDITRF